MEIAEMDEKRLLEIRTRAEAATGGPWELFNKTGVVEIFVHNTKSPVIPWTGFEASGFSHKKNVANARFIAHARQDVPDLIAALRESERKLAEVREDSENLYKLVELAYNVNPAYEYEFATGMKAHRDLLEKQS
jgi:hypothetical protein